MLGFMPLTTGRGVGDQAPGAFNIDKRSSETTHEQRTAVEAAAWMGASDDDFWEPLSASTLHAVISGRYRSTATHFGFLTSKQDTLS